MARFLTQFKRKYTVLNHIGFNSPHLSKKENKEANGMQEYLHSTEEVFAEVQSTENGLTAAEAQNTGILSYAEYFNEE